MIEFFLGGARSGKSRLAEAAALNTGLPCTYIATAEAGDAEMAARIAHHKKQRGGGWKTVEAPRGLARVLQAEADSERCLLVDCLTLWLSNCLLADEGVWAAERQALLEALPALPGHIVLVSNEVGQGVVPANALARRFVDESGRLHQAMVPLCDRVTFVVAGLPQVLKET